MNYSTARSAESAMNCGCGIWGAARYVLQRARTATTGNVRASGLLSITAARRTIWWIWAAQRTRWWRASCSMNPKIPTPIADSRWFTRRIAETRHTVVARSSTLRLARMASAGRNARSIPTMCPVKWAVSSSSNGCYYVSAQSGGGHFPRPERKLETFVSYDFENWVEADCMGLLRGNIPPRPMVDGSHAGEQIHLGAGLWNRENVIIGIYGQWHGASDER